MTGMEISLEENVATLRQLIEKDGRIYSPKDNEFLEKFIRARKYDAKAAFETLQRYYEMRSLYHDDFQNFHPSPLHDTLCSGIFTVLKKRDPLGRKVLIFRTERWITEKFSVNEVFLTALLLGEEMILSTETQDNGTVMIHDLSHLGLCHARQFTLKQIKKFIAVLQGAFPAKFKAIHVINQPYIHNVLLAIAQPFLSSKFLSRILLHGTSISKLHEFIPPEILPEYMGGCLSQEEAEDKELMEKLLEKEEYYKELLKYGYKS